MKPPRLYLPRHYILKDGKVLPVRDVLKWARWLQTNPEARTISKTLMKNREPWITKDWERNKEMAVFRRGKDVEEIPKFPFEEFEVSTVFLGLDHNWSAEGPPIVFETLVFGGPLHDEMKRYATLDEAEIGHLEMCRRCDEALRPQNLTKKHYRRVIVTS